MGWPKAPLPSPKLVWNGFSLDSGSSARISSIFCCGGCLYCNYISKPKLGHSRMSVDRTNLKSVLARLKAMRTSIPDGERVVQEHYAEDYGALLAIVQASLSEDLAFFELPPSTTVRVEGLSPGGIWVEHFSSKLLQLIAHVEAVLRAPLRIRDLTEDDWLNGLWPSAAMLAPEFPGVSRAPIELSPLQDRAQAISSSEYCHTAAARRSSWTRRRML